MAGPLANDLYAPRDRGRREDNVIPLINIVFLLLVFYLLVGRLADPHGPQVDPPVSGSEKPLERAPVVLVLEADHSLSINGEPVAFAALDAALAPPRRNVVVKADREVKAAALDRLFDALRAQQVTTVTLYSKPAEPR